MRCHAICFTVLLATLAFAALPASAVQWMAGSLDEALAASEAQGKPLLIFAFVQKLAETDTTTSAERDCQQLEQIVLSSAPMADLMGRFVCLRVNVRVNETLFAKVGTPRKIPSLIFLRPGESDAFAHVGGIVVGATETEVIDVIADRVRSALSIYEMAPVSATLGVDDKQTLARAYLSLGMRAEAIPLLRAVIDAGGAVDKDAAIDLSLLYLMHGEPDEAITLLNGVLSGVKVRKWVDGSDAQLYWSGANEYYPMVFEKATGELLGVIYTTTNNAEYADLTNKIEFLATRALSPQEASGLYAANVGDACFTIENTRLALTYYERARLDPALPLDRLETAWARIALCQLYLEDMGKARTEMELFLSKFTTALAVLDPKHPHYRPQIMVYLAATYDQMDDIKGARRVYQQVVDEYGGTEFDDWATAAQAEIRDIDMEAAKAASER